MTYFTIIHIIVLATLFVLFLLLGFLAFKQKDKKLFWSIIFANTLVISMLAVFFMIVIDKYTKIARIENFSQQRVLRNETIVFKGKIRNIGKFQIGKCYLEIKLVSNPVSSKQLGSADLFKPTSGLSFFKNDEKSSTIRHEFIIAQNLKPRELKNFSVSMPFPPYFSKPSEHHYLRCH